MSIELTAALLAYNLEKGPIKPSQIPDFEGTRPGVATAPLKGGINPGLEHLGGVLGQAIEEFSNSIPRKDALPSVEEIRLGDLGTEPVAVISGVPDQATDVLTADGEFTCTLPDRLKMMFAEPGVLLVGADFPQGQIDASGGHIERFNPVNQALLDDLDAEGHAGPTGRNVPEGGFLMATGATMNIEVDGININLPGEEGRNWIVAIRGLFPGEGDRNRTAVFSDYVPGHAQTMMLPPGAFISEGMLDQMTEVSLTGGTNCGDSGCETTRLVVLDLNTGAYTEAVAQRSAQMELWPDWEPGHEILWQVANSNW